MADARVKIGELWIRERAKNIHDIKHILAFPKLKISYNRNIELHITVIFKMFLIIISF